MKGSKEIKLHRRDYQPLSRNLRLLYWRSRRMGIMYKYVHLDRTNLRTEMENGSL